MPHSTTTTTTTAAPGPMLQLSNGVSMPALGFGTFANAGSQGETHRAVVAALEAGYRHLDCAWFYQNEGEVGTGLRAFLAAHPDVHRRDIFLTTKVWQHLHEPADVAWSLESSLAQLQTDYVDAFLIHWPIACEKAEGDTDRSQPGIGPDGKYIIKHALTADPTPTWRAMEALYHAGKARAIGVSNWTLPGLESLLQYATVPPHINQIEIHPFLPNDALVAFCASRHVQAVAYSPLGSQDQVPGTGEKVATNPQLRAIAARNGIELAQLLIAWGLRRGYAVLPKSSNEGRIRTNAQLVQLSEEDFAAVNAVAKGRRSRFVNMKETFGYDVWPEEADA